MPKRIVRDGILTSDKVAQLDWGAEVFYRRLMQVADDFGRYDGRTPVLRSHLYPLVLDKVREADVSRWLAECEKAGLVRLYAVNSKPYVEIWNFGQRTRTSRWPAPPGVLDPPDLSIAADCGKQPQSAALVEGEYEGAVEGAVEGERASAVPQANGHPIRDGDFVQMRSVAYSGSSSSIRTVSRKSAEMRWQHALEPLYGASTGEGTGRHPPGSRQHTADQTSASRLFDEVVWPHEVEDDSGRRRLEAALKIAKDAPKRATKSPMAYVTDRLNRELGATA